MKVLVIRQPWAWAIIHAGKDIENRSWNTNVRGRFLVAAAKGMTKAEYGAFMDFVYSRQIKTVPLIPAADELQRGGIIGSVELVDCIDHTKSKWYEGEYGFLLRDPMPLPFRPIKGRLGFFEEPK